MPHNGKACSEMAQFDPRRFTWFVYFLTFSCSWHAVSTNQREHIHTNSNWKDLEFERGSVLGKERTWEHRNIRMFIKENNLPHRHLNFARRRTKVEQQWVSVD